MVKSCAIYTRVSTASQSCEAQELELREVACRADWKVVEVYVDHGISGAKGRRDRPALDRLLKDAARRRFDLVAVTAVDRLGRSLPDLLGILGDLHAAGIDLFVRREGLDTTSPSGRAAFGLMGLFAELERNLIRERVLAGLARARAKGQKLGRPRLPEEKARAIREAIREGDSSLREIAAQCRVGLGTVQRIRASLPCVRARDTSGQVRP
jgi:DNA invertase Pin-like site-specific DNA recombinase